MGYNLCHKKIGANQLVSDRDVKKMRMVLAVLSNNTWGGYCGGHGRTANQITHSPRQNGGGDDEEVYVDDNDDVGEKDERVEASDSCPQKAQICFVWTFECQHQTTPMRGVENVSRIYFMLLIKIQKTCCYQHVGRLLQHCFMTHGSRARISFPSKPF